MIRPRGLRLGCDQRKGQRSSYLPKFLSDSYAEVANEVFQPLYRQPEKALELKSWPEAESMFSQKVAYSPWNGAEVARWVR